MIKNQFIQFYKTIEEAISHDTMALPIYLYNGNGVSFYVDKETLWSETDEDDQLPINISLCNQDGTYIPTEEYAANIRNVDGGIYARLIDETLITTLAPAECFRLIVVVDGDIVGYSQLLQHITECDKLSTLSYFCNEEQFGIPFSTYIAMINHRPQRVKGQVKQTIHILLKNPQFEQKDKIYEKLDGEQVVLFSSITKEYECETDYIPEEWHERIMIALACDDVYINGERVTKSESYDIDHEHYTISDCGVRLTRATFKVKTNITQRNSNY